MDLRRRHALLFAGSATVGLGAVLAVNPFALATGLQPAAAGAVSTLGDVTIATGASEFTPWGELQVRVTIKAHRITHIALPVLPHSPVSRFSVPSLVQEAMTAQGAAIHAVSGATYTSHTFVTSLQAALHAAHFN